MEGNEVWQPFVYGRYGTPVTHFSMDVYTWSNIQVMRYGYILLIYFLLSMFVFGVFTWLLQIGWICLLIGLVLFIALCASGGLPHTIISIGCIILGGIIGAIVAADYGLLAGGTIGFITHLLSVIFKLLPNDSEEGGRAIFRAVVIPVFVGICVLLHILFPVHI